MDHSSPFLSYEGWGVPRNKGAPDFQGISLLLCTVQPPGDFKPLTQCFMHLKAGNQTQGAPRTRTFKRNWHLWAVLGAFMHFQFKSVPSKFCSYCFLIPGWNRWKIYAKNAGESHQGQKLTCGLPSPQDLWKTNKEHVIKAGKRVACERK